MRTGWRLRFAILLASLLIVATGLPASPAPARGEPVAANQAHTRSGSGLDNLSVSSVPVTANTVGTPGRASMPLLDALVAIHRVACAALLREHAVPPSQAGIRGLAHAPSRERSPPAAH